MCIIKEGTINNTLTFAEVLRLANNSSATRKCKGEMTIMKREKKRDSNDLMMGYSQH